MRKSVALLGVLLLISGALGACNSAGSSPSTAAESSSASAPAASADATTEATAESTEPVELVVWHLYGTEGNAAAFAAAKAGFEAEHPNVTIKDTFYEVFDVMAALSAAMPAGNGPDVVNIEGNEAFLGEMVRGGYAYDLTAAYADPELGWDAKLGSIKDRIVYNGKPYGVGHSTEFVVLYYNAGLFEQLGLEPPTTWELMMKAAEAGKANGIQPFAQGDLVGYGAIHACGGVVHAIAPADVIREAEFLSGTKTWREPILIEAARQCQDWVRDGIFPTNVTEINEDESAGDFFTGGSLMHTTGIWESRTETDQDIRTVAMPQRDPSMPLQASGGLHAWMINEATEHPDVAIDFLDYVNFSQTSNDAFYEAGWIPTNAEFKYSGSKQHTVAFGDVPGVMAQISAGGGLGHWIGYEANQTVIDAFNPTWQRFLALKMTPEELGETMAKAMEEARAAQ